MGLVIKSNTAVFTHKIFVPYVLPSDVKIHFDFGGTVNESKINQVTGLPATVSGSPVINRESAILNNVNGFKTDLLATGTERSYIAIAKGVNLGLLMGHTTYDGSPDTLNRRQLYFATDKATIQIGGVNAATSATLTNVSTKIRFFAGVVGEANSHIYTSDSGVLSKVTGATGANVSKPNSYPFLVGAHNTTGTTFPAAIESYEILYFDRALTDAEINAMYVGLKTKYADRSIAVE